MKHRNVRRQPPNTVVPNPALRISSGGNRVEFAYVLMQDATLQDTRTPYLLVLYSNQIL
jgi:hypothetical protein